MEDANKSTTDASAAMCLATCSPLAASIITNNTASPQSQSALMSLPAELLRYIFSDVMRKWQTMNFTALNKQHRVHREVLSTCRLAYVHGHNLPYSINSICYHADSEYTDYVNNFGVRRLLCIAQPWQWLTIRSIDFTASQKSLEDGALLKLAQKLPFIEADDGKIASGSRQCTSNDWLAPREGLVAARITKLTMFVDLSRSAMDSHVFGLDPGLSYLEVSDDHDMYLMHANNRKRLQGNLQGFPAGSWGQNISLFRNLTDLRLVLDTNCYLHVEDNRSLGQIVSCARHWRFCMTPDEELRFDKIVKHKWAPRPLPTLATDSAREMVIHAPDDERTRNGRPSNVGHTAERTLHWVRVKVNTK